MFGKERSCQKKAIPVIGAQYNEWYTDLGKGGNWSDLKDIQELVLV